jgi:hypothetical protein
MKVLFLLSLVVLAFSFVGFAAANEQEITDVRNCIFLWIILINMELNSINSLFESCKYQICSDCYSFSKIEGFNATNRVPCSQVSCDYMKALVKKHFPAK